MKHEQDPRIPVEEINLLFDEAKNNLQNSDCIHQLSREDSGFDEWSDGRMGSVIHERSAWTGTDSDGSSSSMKLKEHWGRNEVNDSLLSYHSQKGDKAKIHYESEIGAYYDKPGVPEKIPGGNQSKVVRTDENGNVVYVHKSNNPDFAVKVSQLAAKRINAKVVTASELNKAA